MIQEEQQQALLQTISDRLQERMKISGLDVPALVKKSGVSRAMIYLIINCSINASIGKLAALAWALDIPVWVLVS